MRKTQSATAATLVFCAVLGPVLAGEPTLRTYRYFAQENCMSADQFSGSGFAAVGPASIGMSNYTGTITFDSSNNKAFVTQEGTFMGVPQFSGQYPVIFWTGQCLQQFNLSRDRSFTLDFPPEGCTTQVLNGPVTGATNVVTNTKVTGQFSIDMKSFVAGHAGNSQPVVQTLSGPGYTIQRICSSVVDGVEIGRGGDNH